jgi:hypothetical protein
MATCAVIGQATGTAAAMCTQAGLTPRELAADRIGELQQALLKDDAYILEVAGDDPRNLAADAAVTASSQQQGSRSEQILSGVTRQVGSVTHQWASDPEQSLPQWLQVDLPRPAPVDEIHLTFDSGFARALTLTHHDRSNAQTIRGPQPETVRDYTVEARVDGLWRPVITATGNYQRKIVHHITPVMADSLRLTVHAANGDPSARVFEIRAYGPKG